jgi:LacI family transcriptional regulator
MGEGRLVGQKVTIEDIAKQSHASVTTVSLVLRNKPGISAATRRRVLDAARELGYHRAAVGPERGALTVGLALRARTPMHDNGVSVVNPFYAWVMTGIEAAARQERINLLYATIPVDDQNHPLDLPHQLLDQALDGLLLIGAFAPETVTDVVAARPTPIILVDAHAGAHRYDVVTSDNRGGAYGAVTHLIQRGHRRIALATRPLQGDPVFAERREGYLEALRAHGLPEYIFECGPGVGDDVSALLGRHPEITAVFGCNDAFAIAALEASRGLGRRVPEDVSIIGLDDIELALHVTPPLTTMAVDKISMGRLAVQVLLFRLAWPEAAPTLTLLRPRLIERGSVAAR